MVADSLITARVTSEIKARFRAVAYYQGLSESRLKISSTVRSSDRSPQGTLPKHTVRSTRRRIRDTDRGIARIATRKSGTMMETCDPSLSALARGRIFTLMTDYDGKRQAVFGSIIDRARSQGYLIRSEVIDSLPAAMFTQALQQEVLCTLSTIGIIVADAPLTPAELAGLQARCGDNSEEVIVSASPAGEPTGAPIVVLHVGAEGGAIRLIAQELTSGWRYRCTMLDQTDLWLEEGGAEIRRQSKWIYAWNDALAALDRYPWAHLRPLAVNPQFADRVLVEVEKRLARATPSPRVDSRLAEWSALCQG